MTINNSTDTNILVDDDLHQDVIPEQNQTTIEEFIAELEDESFEYPIATHLSATPTDEELAALHAADDEEISDEDPAPPTGDVTPPISDASATITLNGQDVPLADIQRLYEFDQYLRQNPDISNRVAAAINPVPAPEPDLAPVPAPPAEAPVAVTPPPELDLDDPVQRILWDRLVAVETASNARLDEIAKRTTQVTKSIEDRQAVIDTEAAIATFRTAHPNFNDENMAVLRRHAASMNVLPTLLTSMPTPIDAVARSLELAALDHEASRTLFLTPSNTPAPTRTQHNARRKSQLSALAGSSGSVPRQTSPQRPQSDREAIDTMAEELSKHFQR